MIKHKNDIINKNQKILKVKDQEIDKLKEQIQTQDYQRSNERNKNSDLYELFKHPNLQVGADHASDILKENKTPVIFEKK